MIYSDRYRVERIAEIGRQLLDHLERERMTSEQILDDYAAQWLVTTPLYNIGEQVYCLSSTFKDAHPEIPWRGIAGLRHHLVHDYDGTNWNLIVEVLFNDLPTFIAAVERISFDG